MNIFTKVAVSGLALSVATMASAANSISGSTDFRVTLPEILVLYHWDDAHLILNEVTTTPANDSDSREISDVRDHELGALINSPYIVDQNSVATDTPTDLEAFDSSHTIAVTLQNSWAVRSLSTGDVTLKLATRNGGVLNNVVDSTSKVTVKDAVLASADATSGSDSVTMKLPSQWAPVKGDIKFNLDLSTATRSGEYNMHGTADAAGDTQADNDKDTFLLTLTGNVDNTTNTAGTGTASTTGNSSTTGSAP